MDALKIIEQHAAARSSARPAPRPIVRRRIKRASPNLFQWAGIEAIPRAAAPKPFDPKRLVQAALAIWRASSPVAGTLGERFFTARHLAVPGPGVARFHGSPKFYDVRSPGLVWLLCDERTGEPCGVLRVYLADDGTVIARRILGRAVGSTINRVRPP